MEQKENGNAFVILDLVATGWAATIQMPMRKRCGKHFPGAAGLAGFVWIILWAGQNNSEALIWFAGLFLLSCFWNHIGPRVGVHTHYSGDPWLARIGNRGIDDRKLKLFAEPFAALVFGVIALEFDRGLGLYLTCGAAVMLLTETMLGHRDQTFIDRSNDAMLETRHVMAGCNGRRF